MKLDVDFSELHQAVAKMVPEPTIHDLHSTALEPLLVIIEKELDSLDRKQDSAKRFGVESVDHYFSGQIAALNKLRRNLAATQAAAIERETGA
jgi:hypothetical protein